MSDDYDSYTRNQLTAELRRLRGLLAAQARSSAGGSIVSADDDPHARHTTVISAEEAVLLENVDVVVVEPYRAGEPGDVVLGLMLGGRINRSTDRSQVLYLFDADGAAAIVSELTGLATRIGPGFSKFLLDRLEELP